MDSYSTRVKCGVTHAGCVNKKQEIGMWAMTRDTSELNEIWGHERSEVKFQRQEQKADPRERVSDYQSRLDEEQRPLHAVVGICILQ